MKKYHSRALFFVIVIMLMYGCATSQVQPTKSLFSSSQLIADQYQPKVERGSATRWQTREAEAQNDQGRDQGEDDEDIDDWHAYLPTDFPALTVHRDAPQTMAANTDSGTQRSGQLRMWPGLGLP